jgi:CTD kinase subunit beta
MFEERSKIIIGLERLMLEASGFDFRNRYPQRLVLKITKHYSVDKATIGKTAYNMSMDLYRTFAPLKQTTATLAIACVELAARVFNQEISELETGKDYKKWPTSRPEVMGLWFSN